MPTYPSAPAVAVIDQNNVLTLSFTPVADPITGLFTNYNYWNIVTTVNAGPTQTAQFLAPIGYTGGSLTFSEILSAGIITLTMQAFDHTPAALTNLWQTGGVNTTRTFPTELTQSSFNFSSTSLLLGQTLTVTLNSAYTGADQWQVIWPDNTSTGWLPLASNVVTKSFSVPGAANVVIQTRRLYTAIQFAPPTTLISQNTQQIFVVDQQAPSTSTAQSGLTGTLGIGGQQGFEIVNATSGTVAPEPWEVIARALVRDSVTSELKLLIATSRFSNASSLFGTMALDVFPIEGRPRSKELIVPPYELTVTSTTETVPVRISTTALPILFVGKSVTQALGGSFELTAQNGITPYIWSSVGLPDGLTINASGVLNGTPLELGQFSVTVAVQDSSSPFSIDEITLPLTVETDLLVEIAPNQSDANNTLLAQTGNTLGVARVGTPYNVQMVVGNIDTSATAPGGLPPYTWSAPAGMFPTGLSITTSPNSLFGLVSGTPSTYNSTTDFNTIYSVTIQVTDSIGAKATHTYSMTLAPEALTFGHLNQTTLYTFERFKLVVPVFGGQSPYTFNPSVDFQVPTADTGIYGTPALVDGQIEIPVAGGVANITATSITSNVLTVTAANAYNPGDVVILQSTAETFLNGQQVTVVGASGSNFTANFTHANYSNPSDTGYAATGHGITSTGSHTFSLRVTDNQLATTGFVQFSYTVRTEISDFRTIPGYLVNWAHPADGSWALNDTSQAGQSVNHPFAISGNFLGLALTGLRVNLTAAANAVGLPLTTSYTMLSNSNFAAFVGQIFYVSGFANANNNGTFTCTASSSTVLTLNNTLGVAQAASNYVLTLTSASTAAGSPATTVYTYSAATYGNGLNNALAGVTFTVAGFVNGSNNGSFVCTASTATTVTLLNASGVAEVHAGTATTHLAKALGVSNTPNGQSVQVLSNGITLAVDPTNLTVSATPDAEWAGPPGPNVSTTLGQSAIFRNSETRIPMSLQQSFALASVAASGPDAIYTFASPVPAAAANGFATHSFIITGFSNAVNNNAVSPFDSSASTTPFTCSASTSTTMTISTVAAIAETNSSALAIDLASFEQVSRDYTTLSRNNVVGGDIGVITTYTRPYVVGDVVGFNPRKPYFDSPDVPAFTVNPWIAIVQGGSVLPPGLSLDANTGLIYGTLAGVISVPSVIQYIDVSGAVHGTITVNWITYKSDFVLTDNIIDSQIVGTVYNGATAFNAPPGVTLQSVSLAYGVLPLGLSLSTDGTNIIISGTPTEAGFFDCWFQAQSTNNQTAFSYHRISTIIPVQVLTIVGWADILSLNPIVVLGPTMSFPLPNAIVSANYVNPVSGKNVTLVAQYGDPPYTFSSSPVFPYHGINLSANDVPLTATAGELSGGPVTAFSPNPQTFTFTVTDSSANSASVITAFASQTSALAITPPTIPTVIAGQAYSPLVTLTGSGSVLTPFNFIVSPVSANQLPVGLTLSNASATTATIQGITVQTGYGTKVVTIRLIDTSNAYVDVPYSISVVSGLALKSGIDFTDGTNIGQLGFVDLGSVDSITARPNLSFFIVATGVVSGSTAGITVQTSDPNITGTVKTLAAGTAQIELSGTGFNTAVGVGSVTVTVIDSGVSATSPFTWTVYNNGTMALVASNAFPTRLTTPN